MYRMTRSLLGELKSLRRIGTPHYASRNTSRSNGSFLSSNLQVTLANPNSLKTKPLAQNLTFGNQFTDHMLTVGWNDIGGWKDPKIVPFANIQMHPAAKVLHYAQELYEGMKAYRGYDDKVRLFRPMHNMARMLGTARRACFPTFDGAEFLECIRRLVEIEMEWVPHAEAASLYIRPTMIGTEPALGIGASKEVQMFVILSPVGTYYRSGVKPVSLLANPQFVRAWPGGTGYAKMGSNYAPTLYAQQLAESVGCQQCLWLFGPDEELTEVGTMNIFALIRKESSRGGEVELVTPPLNSGVILPGVTRQSVLELAREMNRFQVSERKLTMSEVLKARDEGRLIEMFGTGTAAIVSPVGSINYRNKVQAIPTVSNDGEGISHTLAKMLSDIYYGRVKHPWAVDIDRWDEETTASSNTKSHEEDDQLVQYRQVLNKPGLYSG